MKKILVAKLALAGTVGLVAALASGTADAASCVVCHTMHNSQDGIPMRTDGGITPLPILLLDDCFGCHTGINTGTFTGPNGQPKVIGSAAPTYGTNTLAGGDFWWVATDDTFGHNVSGVDGLDGALGLTPPGGTVEAAQLECAGALGCHGDTTIADPLSSLQGAHHYQHNEINDPLAATAVGNSYRFLLGTTGREDTDWEYTTSVTDHNRYAGTTRTDDLSAASAGPISSVCASCHSSFHNKTAGSDTFGINNGATFAAGEWIRHPTDYDMTQTGEFAGYAAYSVEAPVGRLSTDMAAAGDQVGPNQRIVLCVSCHRAHGSPYADMLRWDYSTMLVGTGVTTGCMACHTAK